MKKLLLTTTLFLSLCMYGQTRETKNSRKKANEIARVLQLSQEQTQVVYEIRLEYLMAIDRLRRANLDASDEEFKNLVRSVLKAYHHKLYAFLGKENEKKWKIYVRKKRATKKKRAEFKNW